MTDRQKLRALYYAPDRIAEVSKQMRCRVEIVADILLGAHRPYEHQIATLASYLDCSSSSICALPDNPLPIHKLKTTRPTLDEESAVSKLWRARRFYDITLRQSPNMDPKDVLERVEKTSGYSKSLLSVLPYATSGLLCEMSELERDWGRVFTARSIYKAGASIKEEFRIYMKSFSALHYRTRFNIEIKKRSIQFDPVLIEQRATELLSQGMTKGEVCMWLNDDGWTTRTGFFWSRRSLNLFLAKKGRNK